MINVSDSSLKQLIEIYALSNTPEYLFRRFRRAELSKSIADNHSTTEICAWLNQLLSAEKKDVSVVVQGYAALIALTYKDQNETKDGLSHIDISSLDWAKYIWEHYSRTHTTTQFTIVTKDITNPTEIIKSDVNTTSQTIIL